MIPEEQFRLSLILIAVAVAICASILACQGIKPVGPWWTPTPVSTLILTPTSQFIALPPPQNLTNLIAAQAGSGFRYLPWHYVPDDTVVWLLFGWPEEDLLYKAVFVVEGDEWVLLAVEKMGDETLPPSTMETDNGLNN